MEVGAVAPKEKINISSVCYSLPLVWLLGKLARFYGAL
jgi:hypothetical protein